MGKEEIALNEQFLHFPVLSTLLENFLLFSLNSKLLSANSFSLEQCKICRLGKADKILDWSTFADDNSNAAQMTQFVFDAIENIVGKGENAASLLVTVIKTRECEVKS